MTDSNDNGANEPLPLMVTVGQSFTKRLPNQRLLDLLARIEPMPFGELAGSQPFRLIAFRALLRDYPDRDPTSLWLHAYDCEVDVADDDPFGSSSPTPPQPFAITGTVSPTT